MPDNQKENPEEAAQVGGYGLVPATPATGDGRTGEERKSGAVWHIPTREEILHQLTVLVGMVATKLFSPAQANSIRSIYHTQLAHLGDSSPKGAPAIPNEDVLSLLRTRPDLLKAIQPFLTPEQIDLIVREADK